MLRLDKHPLAVDRDQFLKRALPLELVELDELQHAFRDKALVDRDVPSAHLFVKICERREILLALAAPAGHSVQVSLAAAEPTKNSVEEIEAIMDRFIRKPLPAPDGSDEPPEVR
jgi:hypothetical protein